MRPTPIHRGLTWSRSSARTALSSLVLIVLSATCFDLSAQSCAVPGQFGTIRAALASPGCALIAVGPGNFEEDLFVSRTVDVEGAGPAQTVIMGRIAVLPAGDLRLSGVAMARRCVTPLSADPGGRIEVDNIELHAIPHSAGPTPCALFTNGFE